MGRLAGQVERAHVRSLSGKTVVDLKLGNGRVVETKTGKYISYNAANRAQLRNLVEDHGQGNVVYRFYAQQVSQPLLKGLANFGVPYEIQPYPYVEYP